MPTKKHEPSQAGSVFQLALFVEEMTDPAQLSIPYLPQEQEQIVEKEVNVEELKEFADYIRNHTNWTLFWNIISVINSDKGLSHEGSSNFIRSTGAEKALVHCIKFAHYVDALYDIDIKEWRTELKFFKDLLTKSNQHTNKIFVKKNRAGAKKTEAEKEVTFQKWMKSDRHDFMLMIDPNSRRVFVVSQVTVKKYAVDGDSGIYIQIPSNELYEIYYQNDLPEFYDSQFITVEYQLSDLIEEAFVKFFSQFSN